MPEDSCVTPLARCITPQYNRGMTTTEIRTELPEGYTVKTMKTGLKLSYMGRGQTILKGEKATQAEAIRQAWMHKANVEEMIAIRAAQEAK